MGVFGHGFVAVWDVKMNHTKICDCNRYLQCFEMICYELSFWHGSDAVWRWFVVNGGFWHGSDAVWAAKMADWEVLVSEQMCASWDVDFGSILGKPKMNHDQIDDFNRNRCWFELFWYEWQNGWFWRAENDGIEIEAVCALRIVIAIRIWNWGEKWRIQKMTQINEKSVRNE